MRVADFKAVKNVLGGTLNDVVLATVSGALRRFCLQRGVDPDALERARHGAGQRALRRASAARSATASRR